MNTDAFNPRLEQAAGRRPGLLTALAGCLLLALCASPGPLRARDIALRETIYNTDFRSAGAGGLRNVGAAPITLSGVNGPVSRAYLYWAGPGNLPSPTANNTITVNGQTVVGAPLGLTDDNCWGFQNSTAYRADVTALVAARGNGAYLLGRLVKQGTNVNANGASLLVFFDDGDQDNNRDIVLFEGNDSNANNPYDAFGWNVTLAGINYTNGTGFIEVHVSDGQTYPDDSVLLNGTNVLTPAGPVFQGVTVPGPNNGPLNNGNLWDIRAWEVTPYLSPGSNRLSMTHGYIANGDCVSLVAAVINLPSGAAPPPPPPDPSANSAPELNVPAQITLAAARQAIINGSFTDRDGDPLLLTISIDGVLARTFVIDGGRTGTVTNQTVASRQLTNTFPAGQYTVLWTLSDGRATNRATTLVIATNSPLPVLQVPANIRVPTDPDKATAVVSFNVTVTPSDPGTVVLCMPPSGYAFPLGVTAVTCTAVDDQGNRDQKTFTVTVFDPQPPVLGLPADIVRRTDPGTNGTIVPFVVTVSDNVLNPPPTVVCTPPSGSFFLMGTNRVMCKATDSSGNMMTGSFLVRVVDGEPPVIVTPTNLVIRTDPGDCAAKVAYQATVSDNGKGPIRLVCTPPPSTRFLVGTNTVICVATDASGLSATNTFTITVVDVEPPKVRLPANILTSLPRGKTNVIVNYAASATDNCPGVTFSCVPPSGSVFRHGITTVRCAATDAAGNVTTGAFTVTVRGDIIPPVITSVTSTPSCLWPANGKLIPVKILVKAKDETSRTVTCKIISVTSSEPVDGPAAMPTTPDWKITGLLTLQLRAERNDPAVVRTYTITVECKDAAGNATTASTKVRVKRCVPGDDDDDDDNDDGDDDDDDGGDGDDDDDDGSPDGGDDDDD
jgi:hypothetical protein